MRVRKREIVSPNISIRGQKSKTQNDQTNNTELKQITKPTRRHIPKMNLHRINPPRRGNSHFTFIINQTSEGTKRNWAQNKEGSTLQQLADIMYQFGEIQNGNAQVEWAPRPPPTQRKVTIRFRNVAINRYEENGTSLSRNPTKAQIESTNLHSPYR